MPNIFEKLKAQQDAAREAEIRTTQLREQRQRQQEEERLRPIIEAKRAIEERKEKAFDELSPMIRKILTDLGAVIGSQYYVEDAITVSSYPNPGLEHRVYNKTYSLELGHKDSSGTITPSRMGGGGGLHFQGDFRIEFIFSDGIPSRLQCTCLHSDVFVRKSLFKNDQIEKQVAPVMCGFSEDELANALYQLYSQTAHASKAPR